MKSISSGQFVVKPITLFGSNSKSKTRLKMSSHGPNLMVENMNPCVKEMEYAVRGPLVIRATALQGEMEQVRVTDRVSSWDIKLHHFTSISAFLQSVRKLSLTASNTRFTTIAVLLPKTRDTRESWISGEGVGLLCTSQDGPHQLLLHEDVPAVRAVQLHGPPGAGGGPVPGLL